jgi:hypothetical protein
MNQSILFLVMDIHSEFFEFEIKGKFDVVNFTGRVEDAVRRSGITLTRGVQDLRARWMAFRSLT